MKQKRRFLPRRSDETYKLIGLFSALIIVLIKLLAGDTAGAVAILTGLL